VLASVIGEEGGVDIALTEVKWDGWGWQDVMICTRASVAAEPRTNLPRSTWNLQPHTTVPWYWADAEAGGDVPANEAELLNKEHNS
jgi:hypothetical protein